MQRRAPVLLVSVALRPRDLANDAVAHADPALLHAERLVPDGVRHLPLELELARALRGGPAQRVALVGSLAEKMKKKKAVYFISAAS